MTVSGMRARTREILESPVYPVLLAAYFPLHLMADNPSLFPVSDLLRPLGVVVAAALLTLLLAAAVLRDRHRAALWSALGLGLVCFFFPLQALFDAATRAAIGLSFSGTVRLVALTVLFAIAGSLIRPGATFTKVANVVAATMLVLPVLTLARDELAMGRATAAVEADAEVRNRGLFDATAAVAERPSIVHIVLDGYARQDVLRDVYGFDNSAFLDALRARGFAIAEEATTPYNQTLLVMNSVFSARYVRESLPGHPLDPDLFRRILSHRLQVNEVIRTLSALGYQTAATEVDYSPMRLDRVDRFFGFGGIVLTNFEKAAFGQTAMALFAWQLSGGTGETIRTVFATPHHRHLDTPYFLYLHVIGPHPPFDVDRHGNPVDPARYRNVADGNPDLPRDPALQRAYRAGYVEKLRFVNGQVLAYFDRLLVELPEPKVVILHGDHGGGLYLDQRDAAATCLRERFSPLLAVYSSDGRLQRALPADLNLVNLYRVVFNVLFAADLPLQPSRSFFALWSRPDRFLPLSPAQIRAPCAVGGAAGGPVP